MDEVQTCPVCKNPRKSDGSGSLTQWIVTCECDLTALRESAQGLTSSVCSRCGKRTREALPGSISQFIFSSDCCSCSLAELQNHVGVGASFAVLDTINGSDNGVSDHEEIDSDAERFSTVATDADDSGAENKIGVNSSAVLSSIQKSILEAAASTPAERKPRAKVRLFFAAGLCLIFTLMIITSVSGLFHSVEHDSGTTTKSAPPDETLADRMRMYEDEKWTVLAKYGLKFYDAGPDNTDDDFALLNQFSDVHSIRCLRSESITGEGLANVTNAHIRSMDLNSREISDEGLKCVSRFKSLEYLTVGWFYKVSDAGIASLECLPNLKVLVFNHARLPNKTLASVSKITSLSEFEILVSEKLNHNDLSELSRLPKLRHLSLFSQGITDRDCVAIANIVGLRELDLRDNMLTDAGVLRITKLPLTLLNLSGNGITDSTLSALTKTRSLKKLFVNNCPQLTVEAKSAFRDALPGCQLLDTTSEDANHPL